MASNITRYINWMERRGIVDSWRRSYIINVDKKDIGYVVSISLCADFRQFVMLTVGNREADSTFWRKNISRYESSGEKL